MRFMTAPAASRLRSWPSTHGRPARRWRDRACFREYMRSDAHRISHDRIPADLQAAIKLERLDHLHTYDVVAR